MPISFSSYFSPDVLSHTLSLIIDVNGSDDESILRDSYSLKRVILKLKLTDLMIETAGENLHERKEGTFVGVDWVDDCLKSFKDLN